MDVLSAPIPQISISLAPPEDVPPEPYSPFANTSFNQPQQPDDAFRPHHLTPPPTHTKFMRHLSPLGASQAQSPVEHTKQTGKGLDRARFEALLNASKEKPVSSKKDVVDLRKEVALKAHGNKQAGRRALFLSKVLAPPSPTAVVTPKTPPESPAIFHYTLPSPGLVSPIAHYESLHNQDDHEGLSPYACQPWVEQVDFKLLAKESESRVHPSLNSKPRQPPPSLEQISARLNSQRTVQEPSLTAPPSLSEKPRLVVGRLRMPVRSNATPAIKMSFPGEEHDEYAPPKSPLLTTPSYLDVTTPVISRTRSLSPTELTKTNLPILNSRETRSSTMMSTLRRRTQSSFFRESPEPSLSSDEAGRKCFRRHSAPPESMLSRARSGFEHPVLRLPGSF